MDYSLIEAICTECGTAFEHNALLKHYCSMKIGGACDILVKPGSEDVLCELLSLCKSESIPFFILGKGTNVLFSDNGFRGVIILIGQDMGGITVEQNKITAGAGAMLNAVCKTALEYSLSGAENLYGIPGTVGGALFMNAGAFGSEMKDITVSCRYINERGELSEMQAEDMELSYRHSVFSKRDHVITSVTMRFSNGDKDAIKARMDEVLQRRKDKQPLEFPSCGSTFKRPKNGFAAALIEECGLKGFRIGGAEVSEKHSGFVINRGDATYGDIIKIVEHIKNTVLREKGIELECEVITVDN
ncbi:MAG: UDP-N-acetylmuramate dehydrogenase [Oscillospiraceae bacterium]|nr:UDP-N-acetylmuramate dehydrogenase [Oscillospiraceae bacterium]